MGTRATPSLPRYKKINEGDEPRLAERFWCFHYDHPLKISHLMGCRIRFNICLHALATHWFKIGSKQYYMASDSGIKKKKKEAKSETIQIKTMQNDILPY